MSTGGVWVGGKWIEDPDMEEISKSFIESAHKKPAKLKTAPVFRFANTQSLSPAEYRRRHLGKQIKPS